MMVSPTVVSYHKSQIEDAFILNTHQMWTTRPCFRHNMKSLLQWSYSFSRCGVLLALLATREQSVTQLRMLCVELCHQFQLVTSLPISIHTYAATWRHLQSETFSTKMTTNKYTSGLGYGINEKLIEECLMDGWMKISWLDEWRTSARRFVDMYRRVRYNHNWSACFQ